MSNKRIKRILPIVYDALTSYPFTMQDFDCLTYYEFLKILAGKLNEIIPVVNDLEDYLDDEVRDILNEWLADGTLEQIISEEVLGYIKQFYVPEEFGAVGNGVADDTDAFDSALKAMASGDIKILFIPAKTYLIGYSLAIPEGCMLIGTGRKSYLYYTEDNTAFGALLTNAGNNVTIKNLRLEQARTGRIQTSGAQTGLIGIGTLDENMAGKIDTASATWSRKSTSGFLIENIYSESSPYSVQVETASDYNISDITVRDITAERSLVSYYGANDSSGTYTGKIINLLYDNIRCSYLRAGRAGCTTSEHCRISNIYCQGMRVYDPTVEISGGVVDSSGVIYYDEWYAILWQSGSARLSGLKILGGNSAVSHALDLTGNSGYYELNNCEIKGFSRFSSTAAAVEGVARPIFINGCNIDWTSSVVPGIRGIISGGKVKHFHPVHPVYRYDGWQNIPNEALSWAVSNVSTRHTRYIYIHEDMLHMTAFLFLPTSGNTLATITADYQDVFGASVVKHLATVYSEDYSLSAPVAVYFDPDTYSIVFDATGLTISNYKYISIDCDFMLNALE